MFWAFEVPLTAPDWGSVLLPAAPVVLCEFTSDWVWVSPVALEEAGGWLVVVPLWGRDEDDCGSFTSPVVEVLVELEAAGLAWVVVVVVVVVAWPLCVVTELLWPAVWSD